MRIGSVCDGSSCACYINLQLCSVCSCGGHSVLCTVEPGATLGKFLSCEGDAVLAWVHTHIASHAGRTEECHYAVIGRTPALRVWEYIVALCFKQCENGHVWDSVSVLAAGILSTSILSIAVLFPGILSDLQPARMALLRDAGLQAREIEWACSAVLQA